jgi:hypothetical protein
VLWFCEHDFDRLIDKKGNATTDITSSLDVGAVLKNMRN